MKLPSAKKLIKYLNKHSNLYSNLKKLEENDNKTKKMPALKKDKQMNEK